MDTPLLLPSKGAVDTAYYVNKTPSLVVSSVKWILKSLMRVIFVAWITLIFLFPSEFASKFYLTWIQRLSVPPFGITGAVFMIFSGPILVIAILAALYLIISGEEEFIKKKTQKGPKFRLWTFPVLVDGPFGVVSAAELLGIVLVILYVIWAAYTYTLQDLKYVSKYELPSMEQCSKFLERSGLHMGAIGLFCLAFLFLPISRGSVLLRLIDVPFEHATRYHVWLGHLTMFVFTLHGLIYSVAWFMQGRLLEQILEWKDIGVANLAGVIALVAGLLMWVTSFATVRKQYFELFFYTHQLYIVFVIFLVLHVGDFVFSICSGGIFLFMLDRFLRFWQSRKTVKIISASCLPCGTMELVITKPASLRYNALSFVFLQIRELSWLQWHPFSVSSSPMDGKNHLSVLIKVLGEWTESLKGHVMCISQKEPPLKEQYSDITASVEGPYGHESPYHLSYENLILVAGGIGISPFLAILSDILHRIKEQKPCIPRNILLVWAIKKSDELPLLSTIDDLLESISAVSTHKLNIEISIYVTQESEPPLEEGELCKSARNVVVFPSSRGCVMSGLAGTGNNTWSGIYIISSIIGFVIMLGLIDIHYINPYAISAWWYKGFLFGSCMLASVFIFGGIVVGIWHLFERRIFANEAFISSGNSIEGEYNKVKNVSTIEDYTSSSMESLVSSSSIRYGFRPDFQEIFGNVSKEWGNVDIGVIVCGPATLQSSVAKECRSLNFKRTSGQPIFHFNCHSFDL